MRASTSVLAVILGGSLVQPALADSVYWNGPAGGDWFSDANWVWDGHTPLAGDTATINTSGPLIGAGTTGSAGTLLVGTGQTGSLSINGTLANTSATLGYSAAAEGTVTVSGIWTVSGSLYVGNDGEGTVSIGGGSVTAGTAYLGAGVTGTGALTVAGLGQFSTGFLYVGYGGNANGPGGKGTLTVTAGDVTSAGAVIADGIASSGTATLSGSSSEWNNTGILSVGGGGIGSLTIENGATMNNNGDFAIGGLTSSAGSSVSVTGTGSTLDITGGLIVGNAGSATLTVEDEATVTSASALIGRHSASSATVTGSGSSWSTGALVIGGDSGDASGTLGEGTLTISDGGAVSSTSARLGDVLGAEGSLIVDGALSGWTITGGNLEIGSSGTGSVTIRNGARLSSANAILGQNANASGTATITGTGSSWTASGNIYVGNGGDGDLSVRAGATVSSDAGYVGTMAGSNSSVTIDGSGSEWTMTSPFIAGYNGDATVTLSNGGRISALQGTLGDLAGSTGTMTVTGTGSEWNAFVDNSIAYSGYMNVGRFGDGALTVSNGGSVTGYRLYIGNEAGSSGTVLLTGAGSKIDMTSRLYIGADGDGALTLTDGATLKASDIRIAYGAGVTGTLNIGAASGQAAATAGTLDTSAIEFGDGTGTLVLNHTGSAYDLSADISGGGQLLVENGTTTLSGANSYSGGTTISGGTLIGTSGSSFGTGAIVNNGALVVNGSGELSNDMSGSGSFEKAGSGTLTISGTNTYTGGTTISGGTLAVTTTSLFGNVANYGTLLFDQATDGTFAGDISGTGNLVKDGTGVVTLTGNLTYSGTTTVLAGKLIGNTSTLGGSVINEGRLEFDQAFDGTYSSVISGSGSVLKSGTGDLTLTSANTYTGGTTISAGVLAGNADSFGTGAIVDDAALVVKGAGTFSNAVSGTGTFEKAGSGKLIVTGANTYTGSTLVSGGTLSINGSLTSAVTVGNGATLGGSGSTGGISLLSGATLAPGNSIGTLTVNGNASFANGSTYAVEVDSLGASDRLAASGAVTIGNGVTLAVTPENGTDTGATYALNTQYTIITAAGGVAGLFDSVTENFAFLTAAVDKSADNTAVYLTLNRTTADPGAFAAAVTTSNAKAAANAVEALGSGATLYDRVLYLTTPETQLAFSQLSGELHASVGASLMERSRLSRDTILNRMRDAFEPQDQSGGGIAGEAILPEAQGVTVWSSGFGSWSRYGSDGNGPAIDVNGGGVMLGADTVLDNQWRFGLAGGYGQDRVAENALNASADVDSYYIAAYGGTTIGPASIRFGAIHAFQDVDSRRNISFSTFSDSLNADYDASTSQIFAEGAWRFDLEQAHVEPYANLAYVNTRTDGFAETGGAAALSSASRHDEQVYSTLGVRVGREIAVETMRGNVTAGVGWRHAFSDTTSEAALAYAGAGSFTVASTGTARDALLLNLSVGFNPAENVNVSLGYDALLANGVDEHSAMAKVGVKF
ncbi:autotransporter domain-containing protein [Rhizobium sp. SGZ-381]|uniref:autotransporter domain-containing protein n=1 Tax=Rhizobium sp. SGZ-381 TaxID=3342800 RepID=UPI0036722E7E